MDVKELKERIDAARRVEATVNGATFTMIMPTDHQLRVIMQRANDANGQRVDALIWHRLLGQALVGWSGVKVADLFVVENDEPLAFSAEARDLLLEHRLDIVDSLEREVLQWLSDYRSKREATEKNSSGASSGS